MRRLSRGLLSCVRAEWKWNCGAPLSVCVCVLVCVGVCVQFVVVLRAAYTSTHTHTHTHLQPVSHTAYTDSVIRVFPRL